MVYFVSGVVFLSLLGMFLDLHMKTWAIPIALALFLVLPWLAYAIFKKKKLKPALQSIAIILVGVALAAVIGRFQNHYAEAFIVRARSAADTFLVKQGHAPTLEELSSLMGTSVEDMRSPYPGVSFRYRSNITPIACLKVYQFPSSWLQTCLDSPDYKEIPDRD